MRPTAHTSSAETAATPVRKLSPVASSGAPGTTLHAVPFQCSINVENPPALSVEPTAQMLVAEIAAMPAKTLPAGSAAGDGTTDQEVPFQCSIRLCPAPPGVATLPTAHTSAADTVTACSRVSSPAGSGAAAVIDQAFPFQCSISARNGAQHWVCACRAKP